VLSRCQASNEEVLAGSPLSEQHVTQRTRQKLLNKGDQKSNEEVVSGSPHSKFQLRQRTRFFLKKTYELRLPYTQG